MKAYISSFIPGMYARFKRCMADFPTLWVFFYLCRTSTQNNLIDKCVCQRNYFFETEIPKV